MDSGQKMVDKWSISGQIDGQMVHQMVLLMDKSELSISGQLIDHFVDLIDNLMDNPLDLMDNSQI